MESGVGWVMYVAGFSQYVWRKSAMYDADSPEKLS
jgi:hypothetical protein